MAVSTAREEVDVSSGADVSSRRALRSPDASARGSRGRTASGIEWLAIPVMLVADLLALGLAGAIAFVVRQSILGPAGDLGANITDASVAMTAGWLLATAFLNGYDRRLLPSGPELFRNVLHASVAAFGIVGAVVYLLDLELSRAFFLAFFAIGPPLLVLDRLLLRRLLNAVRVRGHLRRSVIAVGPLEHVDDLAKTIHRERWLGMDIVGAVVPASSRMAVGDESVQGIPVMGSEGDLLAIAEEQNPEVLLFTAGSTANAEEFRRTAWALEDRDIRVIVVPALTEISAERVSMRPVAGLPLVHMDLPRARRAVTWAKRAFDVATSAVALVVLTPVLGLIALAVKLSDGGPVIFRQQRVGHDGKLFEFLKFRTMVTDAEAIQVEMTERWVQDKGNEALRGSW